MKSQEAKVQRLKPGADLDYRFTKILRAMMAERKIGPMAACEALLQEHPEYSSQDALECRGTAKTVMRRERMER